jgi:hypothetical protein
MLGGYAAITSPTVVGGGFFGTAAIGLGIVSGGLVFIGSAVTFMNGCTLR